MSNQVLKPVVALTIVTATLGSYSKPTWGAAEAEREVSTGVVVRPVSKVHPVAGSDEKVHLVYELEIVNHSSMLVSVDRVEALGSTGGRLIELEGNALGKRTLISGGEKGRIFGPSHSGYIFVDIAIPRSSTLPAAIRHQIWTTSQRPAESGAGNNATLHAFEGAGCELFWR